MNSKIEMDKKLIREILNYSSIQKEEYKKFENVLQSFWEFEDNFISSSRSNLSLD